MFFKPNLPAFVWLVAVLFLTLAPGNCFPEPPKFMDLFQPDKIVHLIMFGTLTLLFINGFRLQTRYSFLNRNYILIPVLFSIFMGGFTELLQGFMDIGRKCSIYDFIANTIGSLIGIYLFKLLHKRKIKYFV